MAGKPSSRSTVRLRTISNEDIVVATLAQLAQDEQLLLAFLSETGLDPAMLRSGLSDRSVQAGLLAFLVHNDALIIAVARAMSRSPEEIAAAAMHAARHGDHPDYF